LIRAVVFDFDGVLADSEPLHFRAYEEVFAAVGVELTRDDYYSDYLGYDDRGVFHRLAERTGRPPDAAWIEAMIREKARVFEARIARQDVLYAGAKDCVERLAEEFPLAIASGALRHEIEAILERAGLRRHFRFIVAAGDTPRSKPWPDPYLRAAELHGVEPRACLAIEDSRWGIQSAKAAGMLCVGIATTYPPAELHNADRIIGSLGEFTPDFVQNLTHE
jgi:HAD superfamily hydrolase (TIGR01509 family)